MSQVVKEAVAQAITYESVDPTDILAAAATLNHKRAKLFAAENEVEAILAKQIAHLAREAQRAEMFHEFGYPVIPEEVLTWRIKRPSRVPLPSLAVTALALSPTTTLEARGTWSGHRWLTNSVAANPAMPRVVLSAWQDVIDGMRKLCRDKHGTVTLTTTYNGVMPDDVREVVRTAPFEEHELFLLRDVTEDGAWQLTVKQEPRPRPALHIDPIVVGIRDSSMYMLAVYDPTPLEQYIADEFAALPSGQHRLELGN